MASISEYIKNFKNDLRDSEDLNPLIDECKNKKVVMLGEASHGTHEYYTWRSAISRKLIEEHNFNFIAVEGDWPACYSINRYVKNYDTSLKQPIDVLKNFSRWPGWMWSNWEIVALMEWLESHNSISGRKHKTGFYGLDVYSLWESLDAIINYLKREDPDALQTAQKAMQCFEPHRDEDGQKYALSTYLVPQGCRNEVVALLQEISSKMTEKDKDPEESFSTAQNARIAKNAEEYYRQMVQGNKSTWNMRDSHMMETLNNLLKFHGPDAKAIIWAHNTHIGDALYTDMADQGLYNIGQLAREKYGRENVMLVGFGSYKGKVMAGKSWGAPAEVMLLPEAQRKSWESLCHKAGGDFYLLMENLEMAKKFDERIPHRAVGVVYHPDRERFGNYVPSNITDRYDAFIHIDKTQALHYIRNNANSEAMPNTYPFGL